jgi:hypothetical protein
MNQLATQPLEGEGNDSISCCSYCVAFRETVEEREKEKERKKEEVRGRMRMGENGVSILFLL